jgi:outer membrane protein TolC
VLQLEQALSTAELNLAALRARLLASAVSIYKAMPDGWVDRADAQTSRPPDLPSPDTPPRLLF